MRMIDAENKIKELAPLIDSALLASKFREYGRFGLPGSSSTDGRGGEPPLPMLGNTDRSILRDRNQAEEYLSDAAFALERYTRLARAWCVPRIDDTEKEAKLSDEKRAGSPCKNVWCNHWMTGFGNDRPRDGRCMACNQHWKRHGTERRVTTEVTGGDAA